MLKNMLKKNESLMMLETLHQYFFVCVCLIGE